VQLNLAPVPPSDWVARWAGIIPPGEVLDLAAGGGRHSLLLASLGHPVEAVDRDVSALQSMADITAREADLENGPWPYSGQRFAGIVVANYLHRPLFPLLLDALVPRGVLIYETFMAGNERYGRPSNPDFLLRPNELLSAFGALEVLGFEQGDVIAPKPAMVQRICVRKPVPVS
jgi:SAM-dependent methyltransferase